MGLFEDFCREFQEVIAPQGGDLQWIEKGRMLLSGLTAQADWYREFLRKMVLDPEFLTSQKPAVWPNQVTLYRSPDRTFVVLGYIWESYVSDVIHDHGAWGIVGTLMGTIGERKYERIDDGTVESYADLREVACQTLTSGETTYVLPLDRGIHRMENTSDRVAVSINVYGKGIPRGYTQFFNPERRTVTRVYPPQTTREVLAIRTLGFMREPWAEEILMTALRNSQPDHIRQECEISLAKLR